MHTSTIVTLDANLVLDFAPEVRDVKVLPTRGILVIFACLESVVRCILERARSAHGAPPWCVLCHWADHFSGIAYSLRDAGVEPMSGTDTVSVVRAFRARAFRHGIIGRHHLRGCAIRLIQTEKLPMFVSILVLIYTASFARRRFYLRSIRQVEALIAFCMRQTCKVSMLVFFHERVFVARNTRGLDGL
jgi:hypothetical protein